MSIQFLGFTQYLFLLANTVIHANLILFCTAVLANIVTHIKLKLCYVIQYWTSCKPHIVLGWSILLLMQSLYIILLVNNVTPANLYILWWSILQLMQTRYYNNVVFTFFAVVISTTQIYSWRRLQLRQWTLEQFCSPYNLGFPPLWPSSFEIKLWPWWGKINTSIDEK